MTEIIGWASSAILCATLSTQIYKQWKEKTSNGVSRYLFVGQVLAQIGFIIYSWILKNWVFLVTNSMLLLVSFVGLWVTLKFKKKDAESAH